MIRSLSLLIVMGAASFTQAQGNSSWGQIEDLYFGTAGDYVQVTMNVSDSSTFCNQANKPYYLPLNQISDVDKEFYKTRISVLLAAFMAGKEVRFYLNPNDCATDGRPKIRGVQIKK